MTDLFLAIFSKACWCGVAALGFGILFNSPKRALIRIFAGGFLAGLVKFGLMLSGAGSGIVSASLLASVAVGLASIPVARSIHVPPVIFSVPSVIPLVPGVFAYKTMLGIMKLSRKETSDLTAILADTFQNASITMFIMMAIAIGVAVPMHAYEKSSLKELKSRT